MKYVFLIITMFAFSLTTIARDFIHPGLLHSQEDLNRIRQMVEKDIHPAIGSYELLKKTPGASYDYMMKGPFENIARAGKYGYTKHPCESDCNAAYYNGRHADKAMEILRGYARTLRKIHGPDDPLCAGLQGFMLINAAEIMRYTYKRTGYANGWTVEDTQQTEKMFREVFLPILTAFVEAKPYANGNWGGSVNKMRMAIALFSITVKIMEVCLTTFQRQDSYRKRDGIRLIVCWVSVFWQNWQSARGSRGMIYTVHCITVF